MKNEKNIKHYFVLIAVLLGILPVVIASIAYYKHFYCNLGYPLSNDSATWGTFGDFIGGITNPIYAYLAFAGVIYALLLQREQTELMKQHKKQEDIVSMIENISSTVHSVLFEKIVMIKGKQCTVNDALLNISDLSLKLEIDPDCSAKYVYQDELISTTIPIEYHLIYLKDQITLMVRCLNIYIVIEGSNEIVDLYRDLYKQAVLMLDQIQQPLNSNVRDFFAVEYEKTLIIERLRGSQQCN